MTGLVFLLRLRSLDTVRLVSWPSASPFGYMSPGSLSLIASFSYLT